jgi:hypothetical protein
MSTVTKYLEQFSFKVNMKKTIQPTTELIHCGFLISEGAIKPCPTRNKITKLFADAAIDNLVNAKTQKKQFEWFKAIAGSFQYFKGFLSGDQFEQISVFHRLLSEYQKDPGSPISPDDLSIIKEAVFCLTDYVVNGMPSLMVGNTLLVDTVASVIVVDANIDSWSAFLLKIVRTDQQPAKDLSSLEELQPLIQELRQLPLNFPEFFSIMPERIEGGIWKSQLDKNRSSTVRERLGQCYAVRALLPLLKGPVVLVSDNCNSKWDVVDPQSIFQGAALAASLVAAEEVHFRLWLPRDSVPSVADLAARILANAGVSTEEDADAVDASFNQQTSIDCTLQDQLSTLINDAIEQDTETRHGPQLIKDIRAHLLNPEDPVSPAVRAKARDFKIGNDDLLVYVDPTTGQHRIVVPLAETINLIKDSRGPVQLRSALLYLAHSSFHVHVGSSRSYESLKRTWWWPHMDRDVENYTQSCYLCVETKARSKKSGTLSSVLEKPTRLHQAWMADYCGPYIHPVDKEKRWLLLFIDLKSRYLVCDIVKKLDAETLADSFLINIIYRFGVPESLHCDQGRSFTSGLTRSLCKMMQVDIKYGITYHPRGQGAIERAIGEIKTSIQTAMKDKPTGLISFEQAVAAAVSVHNTSPHSSTRVSPHEYSFGQAAKTLVNSLIPGDIGNLFDPSLQGELRRQKYRQLQEDNLGKYLDSLKGKHDKNAKSSKIEPGLHVYRRIELSGTFKVTGPHIVLERAGTNSWYIGREKDLSNDNDRIIAADNQLHPIIPAAKLRSNLPT